MTAGDIIELEATKVLFYSDYDEAAFFEWIEKLHCVEECKGQGPTIYLRLNAIKVTEQCLRELLSMFRRYEISMRQFIVFDQKEFSPWFCNPGAYWYASIFEPAQTS